MVAVKNWFMEKNSLRGLRNATLRIERETEKACLVKCFWSDGAPTEHWIPKSCICDEWEKETSPFAYHEYLVGIYHEAYKKGIIENHKIVSGRNVYEGDAFAHQSKSKDLADYFKRKGIEFMGFQEWKKR